MSNEITKRMANHYWTITNSIYLEIDKHTIQVLYDTGEEKESCGTAILAKYQNHHFILSAAHVLEMDDLSKLYFENGIEPNGKTSFQTIGKYALLASQKIKNKRINDKVDIAVMELLSVEDITQFETRFKFFDFEAADKEHIPIHNIPYYIVFGYPGTFTKYKTKYRKENERKAFVLNSRIKEFENCEKYGYNISNNVFIDYPKRIQKEGSNKLLKPPNPKGISGSGLWRITDSVNIETKKWNYELVGIMIEVHQERILVATKLKQIDEIIRYINNEKSV